MIRSFTDRILGGVCGGLAMGLPVNAWTIRLLFILLTILSLGVAALAYIALWWIMPQESLIRDTGGGFVRLILALVVLVALAGIWVADQTGSLVGPTDESLFLPAILLLMSSLFFVKQVVA